MNKTPTTPTLAQTLTSTWLWFALLLVNVTILLLWTAFEGYDGGRVPPLEEEWGLLESMQSILLGVTAVLCLRTAYEERGSGVSGHIYFGAGLFFIALFLREVDIDRLGVSAFWGSLQTLLRGLTVAAALIYACFTLPLLPVLLNNIGVLLRSRLFVFIALGTFFYVCGWPFDKGLVGLPLGLSVTLEEMLELNACMAFFDAVVRAEHFELADAEYPAHFRCLRRA